MHKPGEIRVLVLALIRDGDRLFVSEGYDPVKQRTFYRALGGGVEFGEPSLVALRREFQEEIQAELEEIQYLGCLENLYTFQGQPGHELIQLYRARFADARFYGCDRLTFQEGKRRKIACWIDIQRFRTGELTLVPEQFFDYLD